MNKSFEPPISTSSVASLERPIRGLLGSEGEGPRGRTLEFGFAVDIQNSLKYELRVCQYLQKEKKIAQKKSVPFWAQL